MKSLGRLIILLGSAAAILYPPYSMLGKTQWGPLWGDIVSAFGHSIPIREHLDMQMLLTELIVILLLGVALLLLGRK